MQSTYVVYRRNHQGVPYAVIGASDKCEAKAFMKARSVVRSTALTMRAVPLAVWLSLVKAYDGIAN